MRKMLTAMFSLLVLCIIFASIFSNSPASRNPKATPAINIQASTWMDEDNSNEDSKPKANIALPSYSSKRSEFAQSIMQALNAPGLPEMCTNAYFNSEGEFIIEVNGEWLVLDKEIRKDMVYALKELLKESKGNLGVEGYGQFFSDSGQALEAFYAD